MSDQRDNEPNFTGLYRKTLVPLRRYLGRLLGNATEAQDIAHDAYIRVYPKIQDQSAKNPQAVLYTTARRLAINRLKRRSIAPIVSGEANLETTAAAAPGVVQQVMARQELQQLEEAIAQLPEGCRAVLLLRKIELLSHYEIGQRLGIAISTVEKQHARALRLLRDALSSENSTVTRKVAEMPDKEAQS